MVLTRHCVCVDCNTVAANYVSRQFTSSNNCISLLKRFMWLNIFYRVRKIYTAIHVLYSHCNSWDTWPRAPPIFSWSVQKNNIFLNDNFLVDVVALLLHILFLVITIIVVAVMMMKKCIILENAEKKSKMMKKKSMWSAANRLPLNFYLSWLFLEDKVSELWLPYWC